MDIISYSKAMKAKKAIAALDKRLGVGDNKNGDRDIIDVHINTKKRLEELEKKRLGLTTKTITIDTEEEFNKGSVDGVSVDSEGLSGVGSWERVIDLGDDAIEFESVDVETDNGVNNFTGIEVHTQTTGDEMALNPDRSIESPFNKNIKVKIDLKQEFTSEYGENIARGQTYLGLKDTGEVAAPHSPQWTIDQAFNGVTADGSKGSDMFNPTGISNNRAIVDYGEEKLIKKIRVFPFWESGSANYGPYNWYVIASNDGVDFIKIPIKEYLLNTVVNNVDEVRSTAQNDWAEVSLDGDIAYRYWGIHMHDFYGSTSSWSTTPVSEIEMMEGLSSHFKSLKVNYKSRPILNRVSEVEKHTNINLLKHNLRVDTILTKRRYGMKEMIVDDFEDASGIDSVQSVNITHDLSNHKVTQADPVQESQVVLVKEELNEIPTMFSLSAVSSTNSIARKVIDLNEGVFTNTEIIEGELTLTQTDGNFAKSGSWESDVIDLGDNFKALVELSNVIDTLEGAKVKILTATSNDGIDFQEFRPVGLDNSIASTSKRYVKVRIELTAKATEKPERVIHDFLTEEGFESNDHITFDGSAKLKNLYEQEMTFDTSFKEEGTVLRTTINKADFRSIEKIGVV
jgi:hypothetical protein